MKNSPIGPSDIDKVIKNAAHLRCKADQPISGWQDILDIASEAGLEPVGP